jgi:WD40 repeat protein
MKRSDLRCIVVTCTILLALRVSVNAQKPDLIAQTGHSDSVTSVGFSPDGKLIVSVSVDQTIKLWNAEAGKEVKTLLGIYGQRLEL